ncbi:MAG: SGNH/GDSL hydrolase family protein [Chitinophagaceae bacterium]
MKRLLPLLLPFFLIACEKTVNTTVPINNNPPPGNALKTWLALGDSYTIGQGVGDAERFPAQTANWLKQNGININIPYYIATTGWTTVNLQSAINDQNPGTYDVVSLLIGVNDQYQTHDTTGYRQRFTDLLVKAIQLARGKKENVFVLSIPDYSVTPFAAGNDTARIRQEIDWFNAINKSVTNSYNCPYLDITPSTREGRYDRSLIAADGLHPSGLEYRRWAFRLGPMMLPVLR